jgi:uncharacterized protein
MKHQIPFEIKLKAEDDDAEPGSFTGYGSVFGNTDFGGDVIAKGAFKGTLRDWKKKGKLPKMLLQHGGGMFGGAAEDMVPIGQWTKMEEDDIGLRVEGKLLALDTDLGKRVHAAVKAKEMDGLSIGFRTKKEDITYGNGKDAPVRTIKALDLFEVSLVLFGMNPAALIDNVKSIDDINTLSDAERFLCETATFSGKSATAFVSRLKRLCQREVDSARLSDVIKQATDLTKSFVRS